MVVYINHGSVYIPWYLRRVAVSAAAVRRGSAAVGEGAGSARPIADDARAGHESSERTDRTGRSWSPRAAGSERCSYTRGASSAGGAKLYIYLYI